jgi:phosphoribosylformylglycinamidine cyclo-ligase
VLDAMRTGGVHALAHITGGGLTENLPRVLPQGLGAEIDLGAWTLPPVFRWLAGEGGLDQSELLKTFNAGIGMVVVAAAERAGEVEAALAEAGETVFRIGRVTAGEGVRYSGQIK